jgi:hypothetical protein
MGLSRRAFARIFDGRSVFGSRRVIARNIPPNLFDYRLRQTRRSQEVNRQPLGDAMRPISLALLFLLAVPVVTRADSTKVQLPPVRAVRATSSITIDGVLSEAVWSADNAVTDFKQRDPNEGAPSSQKTEVRVAYDEDAVYIGARCYDSKPDSIIARLVRRDFSIPTDRFSVYLDPYHDKRSGYYFLVNAAGTLLDGTVYNDGWEDGSWDGVWSAQVKRDNQGWTVEMRIPYSQLRFQKSDSYVWGINFRRVIQRNNEETFLVYQPKKESGFVSRFPDLVGIEGVNPSGSIEVMPYLTGKAQFVPPPLRTPFNDGSDYDPNGGGDLRMAVGSRLTLNATVNPDFGQVEVDPAVVNLSDYETFFPEKRPFFVEGSNTFSFGQEGANNYWGFNWPQPTFFYSRRIGRAPVGQGPDGVDFLDKPIATTILGAAKLSGKLAPSWNFGTMHAVTAREKASVDIAGARSRFDVEPLTYYGVMRGQKEFKDRRQGLGWLTTATNRSFTGGDLTSLLNRQSYFTGLDGWAFLDKDKMWVVSGWSGMSNVRGTVDRILSLQQNSTHYLQRPDADHVEVDPNATSLTGFGSRLWLNKQKGSSFMNAALGFMDPKFDVNDMGFMSRADVINGHVGGGYKWTETTKSRKYQDVLLAFFDSHDFQGNNIWGGVFAEGNTEFINNYSWNYRFAYNWETINNRRTRGGPLTINKPGYEIGTYFDTDGKAKLFYFIDTGTYFQPEAGSYNYYVNPGVEWKPVSNFTLNVGPGFEKVVEDAQYVTRIEDATASETYGNRYVFADLDQTTLSANIRMNVSFTPNLSFQTFIQPLISSGAYTGFKALARPKTYEFTPYAYGGNPDFNFKSLRGNAIMRWEYTAGSTLFLVWTQERTDEENVGDFNFSRSSSRLFDVRPKNIFLAKLTYYLSR